MSKERTGFGTATLSAADLSGLGPSPWLYIFWSNSPTACDYAGESA